MSAPSLTLRSPVSIAPMPQASEKTVRQSGRKFGQLSAKRGQKCEPDGEAVVGFLRQLYPSKTAEFVAADVGLSATTVRKWLDRGSRPSFCAFVKLVATYGPALLAVAFGDDPPDWLARAAVDEEMATLRAEHARLVEKLARMEQTS